MNSKLTLTQTQIFERSCWGVFYQSQPSDVKNIELLALYADLGNARAGYVGINAHLDAFDKACGQVPQVAQDSTFEGFLRSERGGQASLTPCDKTALLAAVAVNEITVLKGEVTRLADELNEAIDQLDAADLDRTKLQDRIDTLEEEVELTTG